MAEPGGGPAREGFPDPASLRRALREALQTQLPELRIVAEGIPAEVSRLELLAVGSAGELIAIRFAEGGDDAAALTRLLADLSWLRPRRTELLRRASGLGIEPSAEPRAMLVCREFSPEVFAAIDNFPAETIELWRSTGLQRPGGSSLRIERANPVITAPARPGERAHRTDRPRALYAPPSPSAFRTGLVDADLIPRPGRDPSPAPRRPAASDADR